MNFGETVQAVVVGCMLFNMINTCLDRLVTLLVYGPPKEEDRK